MSNVSGHQATNQANQFSSQHLQRKAKHFPKSRSTFIPSINDIQRLQSQAKEPQNSHHIQQSKNLVNNKKPDQSQINFHTFKKNQRKAGIQQRPQSAYIKVKSQSQKNFKICEEEDQHQLKANPKLLADFNEYQRIFEDYGQQNLNPMSYQHRNAQDEDQIYKEQNLKFTRRANQFASKSHKCLNPSQLLINPDDLKIIKDAKPLKKQN